MAAALDEAVASALACGRTERLEQVYRGALADGQARPAQLQLGILQACVRLGRRRAARAWAERLAARPEGLDGGELADAIAAAAWIGQAAPVLQFCGRLAAADPAQGAPARLDAAQQVLALARRMRLPHGRNGAWTTHLKLAQAVREMLEPALPGLPEAQRHQACALLEGTRRLLALAPHH
ncbi:hypothetical protein [Pseudorhodoferax sp.]|uniref:hypothetical protein n=1 Tax=Pseudorhodoferax sp. TaxID=1993553 RepID=UPI0039E45052